MTITDITPTGVEFVRSLFVFLGVLVAAGGGVLWMAETAPQGRFTGRRRRLADGWRTLAAASWTEIPGCATAWLVAALRRLVRVSFEDADRRTAFGGIVLGILFVLLPTAALVNALFGGSPFLLWYYLSLAAALIFLIFAGETGRFRLLNGVAAAYLGVSLVLVIPVYVLKSFTDATIYNVFSHSVLKSVLVAVFWYLAAYGAGLAFDLALRARGVDPGRSAPARFMHQFLAALPAAFVLVFLALLAGHLSVFDQSPARSWQLVLYGTGLTALSLPVTLAIMARGGGPRVDGAAAGGGGLGLAGVYVLGLLAAAALSLALAVGAHFGTAQAVSWSAAVNLLLGLSADGGRLYLGPDVWVMHLPFLPWLAFAGAVAAGLVGKGAASAFGAVGGNGAAVERPFLTAAVSCAGVAVLLWGASGVL